MVNNAPEPLIFITAGSLPAKYPHYVVRTIDNEVLEAIKLGTDVVIAGARQTGKSSLKIRTMQRLQSEGFLCAAIDFTMLKNDSATAEKATYSFWFWVAKAFGLVNNVEEYKSKTSAEAPEQWVCNNLQINFQATRLVLFVDEADAALQYIYCEGITFFDKILNDVKEVRANLQFALLGTALPDDFFSECLLTKQPKFFITTFFSEEESKKLCDLLNFEDNTAICKLVYRSAGGQPQLTQRICEAIYTGNFATDNFENQYQNTIESLFFTEAGLAVDTNLRAVEHTFNHYRNYSPAMVYLFELIISSGFVTFEAKYYEHQAIVLTGMMKAER
ncbi:MAG TPA: hypothetical protein DCQ31_01495, partial [Bacteroidales bacterium]|nr:hypothetical protein [Bacteroidales bacterium]